METPRKHLARLIALLLLVPALGAQDRIKELEAQAAQLQKELERITAEKAAEAKVKELADRIKAIKSGKVPAAKLKPPKVKAKPEPEKVGISICGLPPLRSREVCIWPSAVRNGIWWTIDCRDGNHLSIHEFSTKVGAQVFAGELSQKYQRRYVDEEQMKNRVKASGRKLGEERK